MMLSHGSASVASMTSNSPTLGWVLLYVDDVALATDLYTRAFGLAVRFAHPGGDYTELETGSTALALCARTTASESSGLDLTAPTQPAGNITLIYDDVPAAYARAVEAGAKPVHEPITKPWGQVSSYVLDQDNNLIEIASAVSS
jgi:lactoylglutathione lyase